MPIVTTEHRLRCDKFTSCWVRLVRQKLWSVGYVELPDGKAEFVMPNKGFETEEEALNHARLLDKYISRTRFLLVEHFKAFEAAGQDSVND